MRRASLRSIVVIVSLLAASMPVTFNALASHQSARAVVDFDGVPAGPVSTLVPGSGVTVTAGSIAGQVAVSGRNPRLADGNHAHVFDSTCGGATSAAEAATQCAGGDEDLWYGTNPGEHPHGPRGGVAIVWDGNAADPGDADQRDATLTFDFSSFGPHGLVTIEDLTILDIETEEHADVRLFGADGAQIGPALDFTPPGDNQASVMTVGIENVAVLVVDMGGSGAIDSIRVSIPPDAEVGVSKTAEPASGSTVAPGSTLTYSLTVTNSSHDRPANGVRVTDVVDSEFTITGVAGCDNEPAFTGDTVDCLVDIPVDSSAVIDITGVVTQSPTDCSMSNTAVVVFDDADQSNNTSNTVTHTIDQRACEEPPSVSVAKSAAPASGAQLQPGDALTYTVTVTNASPDQAAEGVALTDVLDSEFVLSSVTGCENTAAPDAVECTLTVPAGGAVDVVIAGTIAETLDDCSLTNVATVAFEDATAEDNTSGAVRHTVDPAACRDVSVAKSADPADGTELSPGDALTYTITVTNDGSAAAAVVVTDELDEEFLATSIEGCLNDDALNGSSVSCDLGEVAGGATETVTISGTVADEANDCLLVNTASIRVDDRDPSDDTSPPVTHTTDDPACDPNVTIAKALVSPQPNDEGETFVEAGDTFTFEVTAEEFTGNGDAESVSFTDTLEAYFTDVAVDGCDNDQPVQGNTVTCTFDSVGSSSSRTATITATLDDSVYDLSNDCSALLINTVTSEYGDDTVSVPVKFPLNTPGCLGDPDVEFEKSATPAGGTMLEVGDTVVYELSITEISGDADVIDAFEIVDVVADGVEIVSVENCPGYSPDGQRVMCFFDGLAAGATETVTITARVAEAPSDCELTNVADAGLWGSSSVTHPVNGPDCRSFSKTLVAVNGEPVGDAPVEGRVGDRLTYELEVAQSIPGLSGTVTVTDTLDPNLIVDTVNGCDAIASSTTNDEHPVQSVSCDVVLDGVAARAVVIEALVASAPGRAEDVSGDWDCEAPNSATATWADETAISSDAAAVTLDGCEPDPIEPTLAFDKTIVAPASNPDLGTASDPLADGERVTFLLQVTFTGGDEPYLDLIQMRDELSPGFVVERVEGCVGEDRAGRTIDCTFPGGLYVGGDTIDVIVEARFVAEQLEPRSRATCLWNRGQIVAGTEAPVEVFVDVASVADIAPYVDCALPETGFDGDAGMSVAIAYGMIALGGVLLHATGGTRRRDGATFA